MAPSSLLEHEFFNTYIKSGTETTLSAEGLLCLLYQQTSDGMLALPNQQSNSNLGNILMISEGRSGSDNVFTLRDGPFSG